MKKFILVAVVILLLSLFLSADVYMKSMDRIHAFELMGNKQKETVQIKEQWFSGDKFAQHTKELSIVIDNNKEKLFFIAHAPRMYYELPLNITKEGLFELLLGLSPKAAEVLKTVEITDVKVSLGGEFKKVANWDCESSEFEMVIMIPALNMMPKFKIKNWTTEDVPFDYKEYKQTMDEFFVNYILGMVKVDDKSAKEMEKMDQVKGFQVASEVTVNIFGSEINVESQCLELSEKTAPRDIYSVPRGYKKGNLNLPVGLVR